MISNNLFANTTTANLKDKSSSSINTKTVHWGHNLAPTTQTLNKGVTTAGIYVVAYGLSDDVMIGTSPWFNFYYQMDNIVAKAKILKSGDHEVAVQSAYFKSINEADFETDGRYYQMEASISNLIYSYKVSDYYSFSTNFGYHYYFDETVPFSIRRESFGDLPYQLNISSFHEFKVEDKLSFGFELGVLGLEYLYPQLITGASFNYRGKAWQMQLGMSFTGTPIGYISSESVDNNRENFGYTSQDKAKGRVDFSAHPEIQLQYYF